MFITVWLHSSAKDCPAWGKDFWNNQLSSNDRQTERQTDRKKHTGMQCTDMIVLCTDACVQGEEKSLWWVWSLHKTEMLQFFCGFDLKSTIKIEEGRDVWTLGRWERIFKTAVQPEPRPSAHTDHIFPLAFLLPQASSLDTCSCNPLQSCGPEALLMENSLPN